MTHQDYTSTAHLCAALQRSRTEIIAAADVLGIEPALRINGVSHFTSAQVDAIAAHFRNSTANRQPAVSK